MTCREKLAMTDPERIGPGCIGGCEGCPNSYYFINLPAPDYCHDTTMGREERCTKCWNREIPGTESITKKESTTMEKKTKTQLIEEINGLKKEIEKLDRYKQYEAAANEMYALYEATLNAGFTKDQAWELFIATVKIVPHFAR